jgi:phage-related protein
MNGWTVETLNRLVDREIEALPDDMRARLVRITELIETHGLPNVGLPHVRPIDRKLWEMRIKGRDGIARALYVTARGKRVVIVRVFVKKTAKTPAAEIEIAKARAKEVDDG